MISKELHTAYIASLRASAKPIASYACPHCAEQIETLAAPAGEQWGTLCVCPHCQKMHLKITNGDTAMGKIPAAPETEKQPRPVFEWAHADTCMPDCWSGHHRPHVQIPVHAGMTIGQIRDSIRDEIRQGAVMGSDDDARMLSADLVQPHEEARADAVTRAAYAAVNRIKAAKRGQRKFFDDIDDCGEDGDTVYAYFVLMPLEPGQLARDAEKTVMGKRYYENRGKEAATWYLKNKPLCKGTPGYPSVWQGLDVAMSGSWQAKAFRTGFDSVFRK